ncbi:hypothetical protein ACOMHN_059012 [Nucella lapillus]
MSDTPQWATYPPQSVQAGHEHLPTNPYLHFQPDLSSASAGEGLTVKSESSRNQPACAPQSHRHPDSTPPQSSAGMMMQASLAAPQESFTSRYAHEGSSDIKPFPEERRSGGFVRRGPKPTSTASRVLLCEFCDASFLSMTGLKQHKDLVHLNRPAHMCPLCRKGFASKDHFMGHMNMHRNIKSHQCPLCPRKFSHKSSLRNHMKKH